MNWRILSRAAGPGALEARHAAKPAMPKRKPQGTCVKGDAGDAMQGALELQRECDAMRCGAVRGDGSCLYKKVLAARSNGNRPSRGELLASGRGLFARQLEPFLLVMGEWRGRGWRNPRAVGWAKKWAAGWSPASEAPARPTPASAQRLLVGSGGLAVGWAAG